MYQINNKIPINICVFTQNENNTIIPTLNKSLCAVRY